MNLILVVLGTLRLTRFITTDYLGHWWFVQPARRWALYPYHSLRHAPAEVIDQEWNENQPGTPREKLVKGLDCPFCVGFWLGALVLLSLVITRAVPALTPLWRFAMGALALNYVTGHVSARLDG
jgi:hypothetical protein